MLFNAPGSIALELVGVTEVHARLVIDRNAVYISSAKDVAAVWWFTFSIRLIRGKFAIYI